MRSGRKIFGRILFSKKLKEVIFSRAFAELPSSPIVGVLIPASPASPAKVAANPRCRRPLRWRPRHPPRQRPSKRWRGPHTRWPSRGCGHPWASPQPGRSSMHNSTQRGRPLHKGCPRAQSGLHPAQPASPRCRHPLGWNSRTDVSTQRGPHSPRPGRGCGHPWASPQP